MSTLSITKQQYYNLLINSGYIPNGYNQDLHFIEWINKLHNCTVTHFEYTPTTVTLEFKNTRHLMLFSVLYAI